MLTLWNVNHHPGGANTAVIEATNDQGVCYATKEAKLALDPGNPEGHPYDTLIEGTPIRVAVPGSIAGG